MCHAFHSVFLLLGSNQGNSANILKQACTAISMNCGEIVTHSSHFFSESWGYDDADYLNMAVGIRTTLSAEKLLHATQNIEKQLGRIAKTTTHYEARTIDIDILFYDDKIVESPQLTIPHPRLHLRNFVLQPLCEIAPDLMHPILQKNISELVSECTDTGKVWK